MRLFFPLFIALALAAPQADATDLPVISLRINRHAIQAEVAHTPRTRSLGLMQRRFLSENRGMLFVFREPGYHAMWMANTPLPLSVAFLDERGIILNVRDMKPLSKDSHPAAGAAKHALEMNAGWFEKRGIAAGARVEGLAAAPRGK